MIYSLNGNRWSLASGEISAAGQKFVGLQSLSPKESVKKERVEGNGRTAVGRTRGKHEASTGMEMLLTEFEQLISTLGDSYTDVPFDITSTFIENYGDGVMTVDITQVTIVSNELKASNDGKALVMAVELDVIDPIRWNGLRICDQGDSFSATAFGLTLSF